VVKGLNVKQWMISIVAFVGVVALQADANAEPSAVLVLGKTTPKEQTVIAAAITGAVKQAQWTIVAAPFTADELAKITTCLSDERPWQCIAPFAAARGLATLIIIEATPEKMGGLRLVGEVTHASDAVPQVEQQYCNPCSDTELAKTSAALAKLLLDSSKGSNVATPERHTAIEVHVTPSTATILLDDHPVTATNGIVTVAAGPHRVAFQLAGYKQTMQDVTVTDGQTTRVDAALVADNDHHDVEQHSTLVPILLIAGGGAAVITGLAISLTAEPGPTDQRHEHYYSGPALALAGAGVLAIGAGIYLLATHQDHRDSGPTVAITPGGATAGWTTRF
jgi:hypothetical protein